jgi:hypothetical protein
MQKKKSIEIFGRTFSNPNTEHKKGRNSLHEFTIYECRRCSEYCFLDEMVILSPFSGRIICQRTGTLSGTDLKRSV